MVRVRPLLRDLRRTSSAPCTYLGTARRRRSLDFHDHCRRGTLAAGSIRRRRARCPVQSDRDRRAASGSNAAEAVVSSRPMNWNYRPKAAVRLHLPKRSVISNNQPQAVVLPIYSLFRLSALRGLFERNVGFLCPGSEDSGNLGQRGQARIVVPTNASSPTAAQAA